MVITSSATFSLVVVVYEVLLFTCHLLIVQGRLVLVLSTQSSSLMALTSTVGCLSSDIRCIEYPAPLILYRVLRNEDKSEIKQIFGPSVQHRAAAPSSINRTSIVAGRYLLYSSFISVSFPSYAPRFTMFSLSNRNAGRFSRTSAPYNLAPPSLQFTSCWKHFVRACWDAPRVAGPHRK